MQVPPGMRYETRGVLTLLARNDHDALRFSRISHANVLAALLCGAFFPHIVYGTDATPQPNASSAAVLEPRAPFTVRERCRPLGECAELHLQ